MQNLSYGYDKFGNLASRKDNLRNLEETFLYYNMNRLTDIYMGNTEPLYFILKDHLGSWTTITDADGVVEQELSFDAWGNLRDPETWSGPFTGTPLFDRGFTGHEHLYGFGLVNMNGRCYDPLTSSFLSVDAYVQDPTSAQSFNRYAYCMHNPLKYVDPTGWEACGLTYNNPFHENWSRSFVEPAYEPRDFQSAYYLNNLAFYGNLEGVNTGGSGLAGGSVTSYNYKSSYGYYVTHYANSVYNYCFPSSQLQLIRNWQDNPSFTTNKELREAGITNMTVGIINGQIGGEDGYRNSYYQWIDDAGMTHSAAAYFEYVGGHENNWYVMSNAPLWSYATFCYGDYTVPASSFGQYVGGMSTLIAGAAKETALAFKTPGQPIPKSPFTKISGAGTAIGIAGVVANAVYNYNQVQNGIMSSQEAWIRSGVSFAEFAVAFIPYVGPVLSVTITAYDLGGGFDNNLYSIGKRKQHP